MCFVPSACPGNVSAFFILHHRVTGKLRYSTLVTPVSGHLYIAVHTPGCTPAARKKNEVTINSSYMCVNIVPSHLYMLLLSVKDACDLTGNSNVE